MKKSKTTNLIEMPGSPEGAGAFLKRLRNADDPLAIVDNLAPHDFLILHAEADDEQRADLLTMARKDQVEGVVDLACWKGDIPDLNAIEEFIRPLVSTGLEGAQAAYDKLGDELKTLLLKRHVVVHLREDKDDEVPAAEGSDLIACPDNYYFIEIPDPDGVPDMIRQIVAGLINKPFEEYQAELECIRHDLPSDLQETAFKWRGGRLADLGFGTLEDGLAILSPRDPQQVKQMLACATDPQYLTTPDFQTSAIVSENTAGNDLLEHALEFLQQSDDPVFQTKSERLGADLGAMTSMFLTGTRCDLGDTEAVARCARWARDILALGLRMVTGDNVAMGAKALAYLAPATILQAGMGMLIPLRQRARKVLADKRLDTTTAQGLRMDPPLDVILQSLSLDIPGRWPPLDEGRDLSPTPMDPLPGELVAFADPAQLGRAEDLLEEAEQLADLACDKLGWDPYAVDDRGEICGSTLVMTALANVASGKDPGAAPVTPAEAAAFGDRVLNSDEEDLILNAVSDLSLAMQVSADGPLHPALERDPLRRLILRLIHLGRARIASGDPSTILVD